MIRTERKLRYVLPLAVGFGLSSIGLGGCIVPGMDWVYTIDTKVAEKDLTEKGLIGDYNMVCPPQLISNIHGDVWLGSGTIKTDYGILVFWEKPEKKGDIIYGVFNYDRVNIHIKENLKPGEGSIKINFDLKTMRVDSRSANKMENNPGPNYSNQEIINAMVDWEKSKFVDLTLSLQDAARLIVK